MTTTMRKPRLDKSRPYSEVHPAGEGGVHFRQVCTPGDKFGGLPFDHEGRLVEAALKPEQIEELKKPEQKAGSKAAAASGFTLDQLKALDALNLLSPEQKAAKAQMEGGGASNDGTRAAYKPPKPPENGEDGGEGSVNLELWVKGEVDYLFGRVQAAVFERFKVKFTKMTEVVDFLVLRPDGPHLVPLADVAEKYRSKIVGGGQD